MPAIDGDPAQPQPEPDEDTLTEADRVPAIDTMVVPPEQARDMIQARPRRAAEPSASRRPGGSDGDRPRRGRRAAPARDLAARPEPVMFTLSYRNRELLNLFVVALLTSFGFASVYIARQDVVSTGSLSYALFFFALYLTAHVVARVTVPQADPYLLPMAGLLTAVGVTEIYRLNPDNAFRQGLWIVVGVAAFSATLLLLRHDYRRLESYKYLFGLTAIGLLVLPALPVIGADGQRGAALGPGRRHPVPAGRAREDHADHLPRGLPAREARGAGAGPDQGLRAAARDLGRGDARPRRDERPRERAPLLRDLPRDALRRDRAGLVRRWSGSASSSPARR